MTWESLKAWELRLWSPQYKDLWYPSPTERLKAWIGGHALQAPKTFSTRTSWRYHRNEILLHPIPSLQDCRTGSSQLPDGAMLSSFRWPGRPCGSLQSWVHATFCAFESSEVSCLKCQCRMSFWQDAFPNSCPHAFTMVYRAKNCNRNHHCNRNHRQT